jgi:argininosuccinate lyase
VLGRLVAAAEQAGVELDALPDAIIAASLAESRDTVALKLAGDADVTDAIRRAATIDAALASCDVIGGTAPARVQAALAEARARLEAPARPEG